MLSPELWCPRNWEATTASPCLGSVDRDLDQFREQVTARYTEGTLGRVLTSSPSIAVRRAAVLALGVIGSFEQSNTALGRALRDNDPIVRTMAESALWAIWFRADSPENNQNLAKSGVSPSFLSKSGVGPSFLPEKMNRHRAKKLGRGG